MSKLGKKINGAHALYVGLGFAVIDISLIVVGIKSLWGVINGSVVFSWFALGGFVLALSIVSFLTVLMFKIGVEEME